MGVVDFFDLRILQFTVLKRESKVLGIKNGKPG